ncbi:MAG TPA: hypothetical protein VGK97_08740 [Spongiibacteraceae bacterium]
MDIDLDAHAENTSRGYDGHIELLIWAALLFNWGLAFVNANVFAISQPLVALCEMLLLGASLLLVALAGIRREQLYLLCFFALYLAFTLLRFMYTQVLEPKPIRDMAIIFVFLCLGMAYRRAPYQLLFRVTLVLTAIGLVEIVAPDIYLRLFNIKSYYINTRGFTEADFWNANSDLFVSGTRPGARFFLSFTNLPRASSVFLEPVSLGNFIIISLAGLLAGWRSLTLRTLALWSLLLIVLLLISDSRYAFACALVLIGFRVALHKFPQQLAFLLFIGVVAAAAVLVQFAGAERATDDFIGRIFYTFNALHSLSTEMLLGLRYDLATKFMDSGLAYFLVSQSLLMLIILMIYYSIGIVGNNSESRIYKNSIMIAWSLSLLISNSLFSIKVAAMMWFLLGALVGTSRSSARLNSAEQQYINVSTGAAQ